MFYRNHLLYYEVDGVEAFSSQKNAILPYNVIQPHQIHSDNIYIVRDASLSREELSGYDALITNLRGVAIGVRTADCVPILMFDKNKHVIAAVHSGWKGTVLKIVQSTISVMQKEFDTDPFDIIAIIGPSICKDCFQVGDEVVALFAENGFPLEQIFHNNGLRSFNDVSTGNHIDLQKANTWLLETSGVQDCNILLSGICTYTDNNFNSARRELNNKCDRIINSIKII